jgi:hypothetical protein
MKKSGETKHTLFEVPSTIKNQWVRKKLMLYTVNVPAMLGIPAFMEFADIGAIYAERADTVMAVLSVVDLGFVGISYMTYTFLQKLVTKIEYNHETDKVMLRQEFGSEFLGAKEFEYSPKELEKYQAKTFNKSIGYRSIKKGENHKRFGTEMPGVIWGDRKLLETIISQPGERLKGMKRQENWHKKKRRKSSMVE